MLSQVRVVGGSGLSSYRDVAFAFQFFLLRFGREALRASIFAHNLAKINAHNAKGESWTMAVNEFADLTSQEFAVGRIGGYKPRHVRREKNQMLPTLREAVAAVEEGSGDDPSPGPVPGGCTCRGAAGVGFEGVV